MAYNPFGSIGSGKLTAAQLKARGGDDIGRGLANLGAGLGAGLSGITAKKERAKDRDFRAGEAEKDRTLRESEGAERRAMQQQGLDMDMKRLRFQMLTKDTDYLQSRKQELTQKVAEAREFGDKEAFQQASAELDTVNMSTRAAHARLQRMMGAGGAPAAPTTQAPSVTPTAAPAKGAKPVSADPFRGGGAVSGRDVTDEVGVRLTSKDEAAFKRDYAKYARDMKLDPNPDDPRHFYDYRGAWLDAGKALVAGPGQHLPSKFKVSGHPREVVDGVNTITGESVPGMSVLQEQRRTLGERRARMEAVLAGSRSPTKPSEAAKLQAVRLQEANAEAAIKTLRKNNAAKIAKDDATKEKKAHDDAQWPMIRSEFVKKGVPEEEIARGEAAMRAGTSLSIVRSSLESHVPGVAKGSKADKPTDALWAALVSEYTARGVDTQDMRRAGRLLKEQGEMPARRYLEGVAPEEDDDTDTVVGDGADEITKRLRKEEDRVTRANASREQDEAKENMLFGGFSTDQLRTAHRVNSSSPDALGPETMIAIEEEFMLRGYDSSGNAMRDESAESRSSRIYDEWLRDGGDRTFGDVQDITRKAIKTAVDAEERKKSDSSVQYRVKEIEAKLNRKLTDAEVNILRKKNGG